MSNKICIAVIGCGRIAQNAHFPALAKIEGVRVKYACDIIIEKAQSMKETYSAFVENAIADYNIALSDPEVEAVLVLTPNYTHYTVTMDALRSSKHVLCEKPITVNYDLSVEMAEEAKKQNKILNIGVCNRYQSSVEKLEQMNREGKFGNIYHVYCAFRSFRSIPGLGGAFTTKAEAGGGVLIDWGIHFLDLILYILGDAKIKSVKAAAYSKMAEDMSTYRYKSMWAEDTADMVNGINDVEDFITGFISTDKATISFNGSWAQNIEQKEMYVDFLGDKSGARLDYGGHYHLTSGETLGTTTSDHELKDMYMLEDKAFFDSIRSGEKTKTHIDNILESMRLLDSLYRSAETGEEIKL